MRPGAKQALYVKIWILKISVTKVNKTEKNASHNFFGQKVSDFRPKINAPRDVGFVLPLKSEIDETELSKNTSKTIFASIETHVGKFFFARRTFWRLLRFGKTSEYWEVVVAQLVEWSLPTLEICGWNLIFGKILFTNLSTNCMIEKTKIKKKRPGMAHLYKDGDYFYFV